jgi:ankyrin repeat protein
MLLDNHAKVDVSDRSGYTPLLWAAYSGHEALVRLLLDRGANPNPPSFGSQQLPSVAAESGHDAFLKTLIEQEGNPD